MRLSSTSTSRMAKPVETGASSSSGVAVQPASAGELVASFFKCGHPKVPRVADPPEQRRPDESDQEYKRSMVSGKYYMVHGGT